MNYFLKILFLLSTFFFALQADESILKVGMELAYPPFEMIDTAGDPAGISVDMAHALGHFLNKKIIIENIPFIGLIPALQCGKIDLIISSLAITEERKESVDFSEPYLKMGLSLLLPLDSKIQKIEDANHAEYSLVVKQATSGKLFADKYLPNAHIVVLEKESACVLEVLQGKSDGFIYDQLSVNAYSNKHPLTTRTLETPFAEEEWGIGLRKNDPLLPQVNQFIQTLSQKGALKK